MSNIEALAQYVPDAWRAWQHLGEIRTMQQRATPHIQALMAMMPEAQRLYAEIFPELQQTPKTSINVRQLQEMLNHYGASLRVDGNYGPATKNAIENYQRGNGLTVDGWAGNETLHHLYGKVSREAAGTR